MKILTKTLSLIIIGMLITTLSYSGTSKYKSYDLESKKVVGKPESLTIEYTNQITEDGQVKLLGIININSKYIPGVIRFDYNIYDNDKQLVYSIPFDIEPRFQRWVYVFSKAYPLKIEKYKYELFNVNIVIAGKTPFPPHI